MIPPCPTTDNPPFVPGTYQVARPPALEPVPIGGFRSKLSQATETARAAARGTQTPAPLSAGATYHQNELNR